MNRAMLLREKIGKLPLILSHTGVTITQEGTSAYVKCNAIGKPTLVNLPYIADSATEELMDAIEGFLDHEVAHLLFTDFKLTNQSRKEGFGALHELLEDACVEKQMGHRFPGCNANLSETGRFFLRRAVEPALYSREVRDDPIMTQGVLMAPALRAWAGQLVYEDFMRPHWAKMNDIRTALGSLVTEIEQCRNTADTYDLAKKMAKALNDYDPSLLPPEAQAGEGEGEPGEKDSTSQPGNPGQAGQSMQEGEPGQPGGQGQATPQQDAANPGKDPGKQATGGSGQRQSALGMAPKFDAITDGGTEAGEGQGGQEGQGGSGDQAGGQQGQDGQGQMAGQGGEGSPKQGQAEMGDGAEKLSGNSFARTVNKMMENNFDKKLIQLIGEHAAAANDHTPYRVFSTTGDKVEPLPVPTYASVEQWLHELDSAVMHLCGPMQKNLERMIAARSIATWQPARRSGRLHAANLSRLACNDARVFRKKIEGKSRDVAVELVVDCSGSMGGEKIYLATQAAYALSTVLGRLNIANEVIGFTTGDYGAASSKAFEREASRYHHDYARIESLYMPVIKGYNERMTANVRNRFAWLPHSGILNNNVDGECVEIAARRLSQRREKGKIMLVLSDGAPSAHGNDRQLEKHLKKVVKEIESSGITVVGLGIHSTEVRYYYSKHLVVRDIEQLPTEVLRQLKELLVVD